MSRVILGEMSLRWCGICDLPIVGQRKCSLCGSPTFPVAHTPPGDIRPAFEEDVKLIRETIGSQFGILAANALMGDNTLAVLNNVPSLDLMDEIIVHGWAIGNIRYDIPSDRYVFIPNQYGLHLLQDHATENMVMVDDDAIPFIERGANCLVPGIRKIMGDFSRNDEVLVTDEHGRIIMSGTAQMDSRRMRGEKRGVGVKSRRRYKKKNYPLPKPVVAPTWPRAVEANERVLGKKVKNAKRFIRDTINSTDLPIAVSYSGGKDSLASLLLVLEAGYRPDIMFVNTGLELPETIENVQKIIEEYSLELVTVDAGDAFYRALSYFGPPAKDYRWCCKIAKLGPAARLIRERYPDGVLSFIGQRQYESKQRKEKGRTWINPWVPNQKGVSPIQKWNALTVWLYLFSRNAPYNPWYEHGLERIGCWLCPASDVADLKRIREGYADSGRFFDLVYNWAGERGLSREWVDMGLWRWRKYPGTVKQLLEKVGTGKTMPSRMGGASTERTGVGAISIHDMEKIMSGDGTLIIKGNFGMDVPLAEVSKLVPILGEVREHDRDSIEIVGTSGSTIMIRADSLTVKGSEHGVEKNFDDALSIVKRAMNCLGCGVCTGRCHKGALSLVPSGEGERIELDASLCTGCRKCMGPCPMENFEPR